MQKILGSNWKPTGEEKSLSHGPQQKRVSESRSGNNFKWHCRAPVWHVEVLNGIQRQQVWEIGRCASETEES